MNSRRDFLKQGGIAAAGLAAAGMLDPRQVQAGLASLRDAEEMPPDDVVRELMMAALDAARGGDASYSDVRIGRYRSSSLSTREQQIVNTSDTDSVGAGIRALVDGTWGFAATSRLTRDGVAAAAREAVAIAKANRIARDAPVQLAPAAVHENATWKSAFTIDPFTIPIEQRAELLLKVNAAAMAVKGVSFVSSGLDFIKEERSFANSDGSVIVQTVVRCAVPFQATATAPGDFQTRSNVVAPAQRGW